MVTTIQSVESLIDEQRQYFDFELTTEQMNQINKLNENKRFGKDPDNFHFDF